MAHTATLSNTPGKADDLPIDPSVAAWALDLDRWLETPEGKRWLSSMEEMENERHGCSLWEGPAW